MKSVKKLLCVLLSVAMVIGSLTVTALADTSGTGTESDPYVVTTADELVAAVSDETVMANGGYIKLDSDIVLTSGLTFSGVTATLDLNGHKLSNSTTAHTVNVGDSNSTATTVTIKDTSEAKTGLILSSYAKLAYGIYVYSGGNLTIERCNVTASHSSSSYATYGIYVAGSCTINSGVFTGKSVSVYVIKTGKITINGGCFNGSANSASSGSSITVNGGYFTAVDTYFNSRKKIPDTSEWLAETNVIDGVTYNYVCSKKPVYNITTGTCENGSVAVDKIQVIGSGQTVTVTASPIDDYKLVSIYVNGEAIEGNTFIPTTDSVVTATFAPADFIVQIGTSGQKYESINEALAAATADDTVYLLKDLTFDSDVEIVSANGAAFDLNGKTLTLNNSAQILPSGNFALQNGTISSDNDYIINVVSTTGVTLKGLSINGGVYLNDASVIFDEANADATSKTGNAIYVGSTSSTSIATIKSGTFKTAAGTEAIVVAEGNTVDIAGGSYSTNPTAVATIPSGFEMTAQEGMYSLSPKAEFEALVEGRTATSTTSSARYVNGTALTITAESLVTVTFNATAVSKIGANAATGNVTFTATDVTETEQESAESLTGLSNATVFQFGMKDSADNDVYTSANGGGEVTITIPYTKQVETDAVAVYYVDGTTITPVTDVTYADGYVTFKTSHFSEYVVGEGTLVAKIGDKEFVNMTEAIAAAAEGDTILVVASEIEMPEVKTENITIQGQVDDDGNPTTKVTKFDINASTSLRVKNEGVTFKNLNFAGEIYQARLSNTTFKNCTFTGTNAFNNAYACGPVTIDGCTFLTTYKAIHFDGRAGGSIEVKNSTITGFSSFAHTLTSVSFDKCKFVDSSINDYYGVQSYCPLMTITDSSFSKNWCDTSGIQCIGIAGNDGICAISNCTFATGEPEDAVVNSELTGLVTINAGTDDDGNYTSGIFYGNKTTLDSKVASGSSVLSIEGKDDTYVIAVASITNESGHTDYYTTLQAAVDAATEGQTVLLLVDNTITDYVDVETPMTIDLGGHTLTTNIDPEFSYDEAFEIYADTTIKNGTISNTTGSGMYINNSSDDTTDVTLASDLTMNVKKYGVMYYATGTLNIAGTISGENTGVWTGGGTINVASTANITGGTNAIDAYAKYSDSVITIEGTVGDADTTYGIGVSGYDDYTATLNVKDSAVISATSAAVLGIGTTGSGYENTIINVTGGTLNATAGVSIFHPQAGVLNISGGTITGSESAVEMRAGTINVTAGTLTSTATSYSCTKSSSGNTTVGAALAIAQHVTKKAITVNISGGSFTGVRALNEADPQGNNPTNITIAVSGGLFNGTDTANCVSAVDTANFITGGYFSTTEDERPDFQDAYVATGYNAIANVGTEEAPATTYPTTIGKVPVVPSVDPQAETKTAESTDVPEAAEDKDAVKEAVADLVINDITENTAVASEDATDIQTVITDAVVTGAIDNTAQLKIVIKSAVNTTTATTVTAVSATTVTTTTASYDVKPWVTIEKTVGEETTTETRVITNAELAAANVTITFRLAVPETMTGNTVKVSHIEDNATTADWSKTMEVITDADGNRYVELSASSFSTYELSQVTAENAVASITVDGTVYYYADLASAVTDANDGDTIVLLADSDYSFTLPAGVSFDTNDKNYTGTVSAPEGYEVVHNGNVYTVARNVFIIQTTSEVGACQGGGTYTKGTTATIYATTVSGWTFEGWYLGGEKVSEDQEYTFTVTADGTYTAKYEVSGDGAFRLDVTGSYFTVQSEEQEDHYNVKLPAGETNVTYTDTGKTFLYWVNGSGAIVSTSANYTFTLVADTELKAVVASNGSATSAIVIFSNSFILGAQELQVDRYTASEDKELNVTYPTVPISYGRTFDHWTIGELGSDEEGVEATAENIKAAILAGAKSVIIAPVYKINDSYELTVKSVSDDGDVLAKDQTYYVKTGYSQTVTAATIEGQTFSHWGDAEGNVIGTNSTYCVCDTDSVTIYAVYGETVDPVSTIFMIGSAEKAGSKYKLSFNAVFSIDSTKTIAKRGFLYSTTSTDLTYDNLDNIKHYEWDSVTANDSAMVYNLTASSASTTVNIRPYVITTDGTVIYGNTMSESYNSLTD